MKWVRGKRVLFMGASVLALILSRVPVSSAVPLIVADHTVVEKYQDIPQYWIDQVKKMWVNVPGESHSSGYRIGLDLLESLDPRFQVNRTESGVPESYTDQHLRINRATWSGSDWIYSYGEEDWFTNTAAINQTKAHITYSNTHNLAIAAMGFGWCWDMTFPLPTGGIDPVYQVRWAGSSIGGPQGDLRWGLDVADQSLTGNSVSMDTYLNATRQFIDYSIANGYLTKVFFTTGPVDLYNDGEVGYQLHLKQQRIRNYVNANDDILFDYADILAWGDDGTRPTNSWTDYGGALRTFPKIHPDNMLDLGGGYTEDGDHIGQRGALRLAKAMWWMLARIAGWDGVPGEGDVIAPTVRSTVPANGATNINPATAVTATFSEPVDPSTVSTASFTLKDGTTSISGTVTLAGTTATFQPSSALANNTTYTATITTGVKDLAGNAIAANYIYSFTTAVAADTTRPTVTSTNPTGNQTGIAVNSSISATFSEMVAPLSVTAASFTVSGISGTVSVSGNTATFTPSTLLANSATYTVTITTAVTDIASNHLASNYVWSFTTGVAEPAPGASSSSSGGGCSVIPRGGRAPGDYSGIIEGMGYAALVFLLRAHRKGQRA